MLKIYEKMIVDMFSEKNHNGYIPMFIRLMKKIKNPDRKWYQFWKPKLIDNPDYINGEIEIDIKRGGNA